MDGGKINLGCVARQGTYEIVSTNLKRLCVNVPQLSNTYLCLFMDFANVDLMFRVTMAQVMQDVSSIIVVTREQKRRMRIKQLDAVTLLLRLIQNFAIFQNIREMSQRTKLERIASEAFCDVALHSKLYRLDEVLERSYSDDEHHLHKGLTTSDINKNETMLCNYEDDLKVLAVVGASSLCAQKTICLETLEAGDAR